MLNFMENTTDRTAGASRDFGFRQVEEREHTRLVRDVFDSVASRYDLMNDLMSGGLHRLWKAALIDRLRPEPGMRLLDLAGGTGDVAFAFLNRAGGAETGSAAIVCDINEEMLRVGRDRAIDRGFLDGARFVCGNAEAIPIAGRSANSCTIAFGLRNVTRRADALREMRRILKPGGHFLCLEFSHVVVPVLARLYDLYSFHVVPALGQAVAGDRDSYKYLVESIREFPPQEELAEEIRAAGFGNVTWTNLSGGIVALHSAWRI